MSHLKTVDPEVYEVIRRETERQAHQLELIASENFVSDAVLEATGSLLTNKYAEGYPGKRYYGGCEFVDQAESLAISRAKKIFGADHVNVQPHSGSQANMAVYLAVMNPGDTMLGMNLTHGGHLTHGSPVNFSGKLFRVVAYGVRPDTETIDFDQVRALALEHRPKLIVVGASAYPRIIEFAPFREIADEAGCMVMADIAHVAGMVAVGLHPNPVPYCEFVTTTTHKTLRGPRGGMILCREDMAKKLNSSIFPGTPGRSAHARDSRQGCDAPRGDDAGIPNLSETDPVQRTGLRRNAVGPGIPACVRRDGQPPPARESQGHAAYREGGRGGP